MPNVIEIQDLAAPALDVYARLTGPQLRHRAGQFVAESPKVIARALDAGCRPVSFLMERRHLTGDAAPLLARCPGTPVYTADREVLAALTGYTLTRGVLCAMERPAPADAAALCRAARRAAVLENIVDTTNLGAIFRSAAALHVDAVLLSPSCCDPLGRRSLRVSMGTVFQVPWAVLPGWPEEGLALLKQPRHRNGWVNMPARAAAGKDDVHTRLRQTRFPLSKSPRFLTAYSSLLSFCREMLRIKPTSKS